jgi:hypothetical protein
LILPTSASPEHEAGGVLVSPQKHARKETSMRSKATLFTTAAALAIGLAAPAYAQSTEAPGAKSDITIAKEAVPSTGGVENSAAGEGATNQNTPDVPATGAGSANAGGPNSEDQGGTGVKGSAESEGATNKSAQPDQKEGKLPSPSSTY